MIEFAPGVSDRGLEDVSIGVDRRGDRDRNADVGLDERDELPVDDVEIGVDRKWLI